MRVYILGSSGAIPFNDRDTTMIGLSILDRYILIECGGSLIYKMNCVTFPWSEISAVFLTHRHIDHLYGFPHLIQVLYLSKRKKSLTVYGPDEVITILNDTMEVFLLKDKNLGFSVEFQQLPHDEVFTILENAQILISSCPVVHGVPTLAYRFEDKKSGISIVYTGDTGPCPELINFANHTDLLIHEASLLLEPMAADPAFHSTVIDAAKTAARAHARHLCLIHFNQEPSEQAQEILQEMHKYFPGPTIMAKDLSCLRVNSSAVTMIEGPDFTTTF